jgi:hypothetical protein
MNWAVKQRGNKYCVINNDTNRSVKCYSTITEAESHRRVLEASKSGVRSKVSALRKKMGLKYPSSHKGARTRK